MSPDTDAIRIGLLNGRHRIDQVDDIDGQASVEETWTDIRLAPTAIIGGERNVAVFAQVFGGAVGAIAGDITLAVEVAVVHDDDRIRRMSIDGDLHLARDGQAVARIADEITSKGIRGLDSGGDRDLAALELMMPKPVNRIGSHQLRDGGSRRGRERRCRRRRARGRWHRDGRRCNLSNRLAGRQAQRQQIKDFSHGGDCIITSLVI